MTKIRKYYFVAGMFLIMLLASCVSGTEVEAVQPLLEGDKLPAFRIETEYGEVTDKTLEGKPSVVVFFHTHCPDCQQELPHIQQLYDKYYAFQTLSATNKIHILLIAYKESPESVNSFWNEYGYTMPCSFFEHNDMLKPFGITAVPTVYVCDKNGVIRHISKDDPIATFSQLDAWISDLLTE